MSQESEKGSSAPGVKLSFDLGKDSCIICGYKSGFEFRKRVQLMRYLIRLIGDDETDLFGWVKTISYFHPA